MESIPAPIQTKFRRILTEIPVPQSVTILEMSRIYEPRSLQGQPPVVWDRAEGFHVYDPFGNMWIDWTSGVLTANVGHSHARIKEAIIDQASRSVLHTYLFLNEPRLQLAKRLVELAPTNLDKVLLISTGAEATETALKLTRTHAERGSGPHKRTMISFANAFHGRTLGAQLMGGIEEQKRWIGKWTDDSFIRVPFPDGFRCSDTRFALFEESLDAAGVRPHGVAGVIIESFQGGGASFAPVEYMQQLRAWCSRNGALLICDEVQGGFGRTGKMFAFEHYGITPDIICCGKGISGCLPLAAVIAPASIFDLNGPGEITTTHTGNPLVARAAIANLDIIREEGLVENARVMGRHLHLQLKCIQRDFPEVIGAVHGKGLVAGIHVVNRADGWNPDSDRAHHIVMECVKRGLLLFAPVGVGGATIKICPPLCIPAEAIDEGVGVLNDAVAKSMGKD